MKNFLILMLICSSFTVYSQDISIEIDTLKVGRVSTQMNEVEHDHRGPYIKTINTLRNISEGTLFLRPSNANYFFTYTIDKKRHKKEVFPLSFMDNQSITLQPGDSVIFKVSDDLVYGTNLFDPQNSNYANDLLKILPTLKLHYVHGGTSVQSTAIKNVVLEEE